MRWLQTSKLEGYSSLGGGGGPGGARCSITSICSVNENGEVDCTGSIHLQRLSGSPTVPFKFGTVQESFRCGTTSLTDLRWLPSWIGGTLDVSATGILSFAGISKYVAHVGNTIMFASVPPTHCLELLLIGGAPGFVSSSNNPIADILNKYRGTGDILACQDELIDVGYIDQARL